MAPERVADMTIEDLKAVIAAVVVQQLESQKFDAATKQLTDQAHEEANQKVETLLPQRTKAEQIARNRALVEWLDKWREEGDEEEQRETFEYLKKVLDEDRLSNRPLFPQQ